MITSTHFNSSYSTLPMPLADLLTAQPAKLSILSRRPTTLGSLYPSSIQGSNLSSTNMGWNQPVMQQMNQTNSRSFTHSFQTSQHYAPLSSSVQLGHPPYQFGSQSSLPSSAASSMQFRPELIEPQISSVPPHPSHLPQSLQYFHAPTMTTRHPQASSSFGSSFSTSTYQPQQMQPPPQQISPTMQKIAAAWGLGPAPHAGPTPNIPPAVATLPMQTYPSAGSGRFTNELADMSFELSAIEPAVSPKVRHLTTSSSTPALFVDPVEVEQQKRELQRLRKRMAELDASITAPMSLSSTATQVKPATAMKAAPSPARSPAKSPSRLAVAAASNSYQLHPPAVIRSSPRHSSIRSRSRERQPQPSPTNHPGQKQASVSLSPSPARKSVPTPTPSPLRVASSPSATQKRSRYLRPEDDPDEDVQVSDWEDEVRSSPEIVSRSTARPTTAVPSPRHEIAPPPSYLTPTYASMAQPSPTAKSPSLARVYKLLNESQNFFNTTTKANPMNGTISHQTQQQHRPQLSPSSSKRVSFYDDVAEGDIDRTRLRPQPGNVAAAATSATHTHNRPSATLAGGAISMEDLSDTYHASQHQAAAAAFMTQSKNHDKTLDLSKTMRLSSQTPMVSASTKQPTTNPTHPPLRTRPLKNKPLTPFEPTSSIRRPGPGGAAGSLPSTKNDPPAIPKTAQPNDIGIFMPSGGGSKRGSLVSVTSTNKLAQNALKHAESKKEIRGHTRSVLARLNAVAKERMAKKLEAEKQAAERLQAEKEAQEAAATSAHQHHPRPKTLVDNRAVTQTTSLTTSTMVVEEEEEDASETSSHDSSMTSHTSFTTPPPESAENENESETTDNENDTESEADADAETALENISPPSPTHQSAESEDPSTSTHLLLNQLLVQEHLALEAEKELILRQLEELDSTKRLPPTYPTRSSSSPAKLLSRSNQLRMNTSVISIETAPKVNTSDEDVDEVLMDADLNVDEVVTYRSDALDTDAPPDTNHNSNTNHGYPSFSPSINSLRDSKLIRPHQQQLTDDVESTHSRTSSLTSHTRSLPRLPHNFNILIKMKDITMSLIPQS